LVEYSVLEDTGGTSNQLKLWWNEDWWELIRARVWIRVFSSLMPRLNKNKSCIVRVYKREFAWEFSQLSCPGWTRTRVAWELTRVEKREFAWKFSQLSCPGWTRVAWELRSESLHDSFLNSHAPPAPVKREQELHESWRELTGYYRLIAKTLINSHYLKSVRVYESWEVKHEWELSYKHGNIQ
jgi:hypothetical protein